MSQFRIITCKQEWTATVQRFQDWDFFHTYEYHDSCINSESDSPWMVALVEDGQIQFALPMVRRELSDDAFDLVSVYGYSGPLARDVDHFSECWESTKIELNRLGCVSLFCRLHPVMHQTLQARNDVFDAGKTVAIMCGSEEDRFTEYRKTTRYEVRKLIRLGADATFDDTDESFEAFKDIYIETMNAVGADPFYFFKEEFLRSLFRIDGVKTVIGSVRFEGQIISSGLFTAVGGIAQYFLGGARMEHSKLAPQKLLLHRATEWAAQQNAQMLHLGGGRGSQEDSLFRFKTGFSKHLYTFRLLKAVLNQGEYEKLTTARAAACDLPAQTLVESGFFPAYRAAPVKTDAS